MDEEFDTSVDTSDVDTSTEMDTSTDTDISDIVDDVPEDIPEDVPKDEPETVEENDLSDDIPEDIPEDEPEAIEEDDLSEDIPEDVPEDEPKMIEEDDLSDDVPEDVPEDQVETDDTAEDTASDVDSTDSAEPIEETQDESTDDTATEDVADDIASDVDSIDSAEQTEETQDELTDDDTTEDAADNTPSNVDSPDSAEQREDTQDEQLDDTVADEVAEETASEAEDTDSAELNDDTQGEQLNDTVTDEVEEETNSETEDTDSAEQTEDTQDEQTDNNATDDSNTLESRMTDDVVSDTDEKSAMDRMSDYMNSHNYGLDDKDTYMSDPEWISINRDLKAELGIPQTAQEQMMDYMGSHNYGIWDRDTYMKDPEWQSLNEALQNEIAGVDTSNAFIENDIVDPTEKRGKVSDFFTSLFGGGLQQNEPQSVGTSFASNDEADSLDTTSQILQQPGDVSDDVSEEQDFVEAIESMDFNDLSDEDKDLMYNTAQKHIGEKYGDLVREDRINEIPKHIKIADTEECRKAYEASGGKYSDNTVGFYCPATDEIYVDAPRNGDMTEIMATIEHESLHLASNGGLNGNLEIVEGMSTYRRSTNLNEGVTELYAMRDMEEMGFDYTSTSYQQQVEVVKALEDAIGKDTIRAAYFNNQPDLIRSEFETAFASESELQSLEAGKTVHNGTYIDFLNSVDQYIDTHPRDPNYDSRRDAVYNWISNLKAKRRIN